MIENSFVIDVFKECVTAINDGELISRVSVSDKEFHFQNWFAKRLNSIEVNYDDQGRNTYPDFPIVKYPEGYEIKGLAYPGRENSYDANSQIPSGLHNGRTVFYVFGRYPSGREVGAEYPVIDLVICHGDFLNADHSYVHKNKSIRGFGTYGDVMIRDRKMYVCATPYAIANGLAGTRTLILPVDFKVDDRLNKVGELVRVETDKVVIGYEFDLRNNELTSKTIENPNKGSEHHFVAYRLKGETLKAVNIYTDK